MTYQNSTNSLVRQVEKAIEGGCQWIQLRNEYADAAALREAAVSIIPICKEHDVIMTIEDDIDLVSELRVHGLHVTSRCKVTPMEAREELGPHAIIGVSVATADDILALRGADTDYATLTVDAVKNPGRCEEIISEVKESGLEMPIVGTGITATSQVVSVMGCGFRGVAVSRLIAVSADPEEITRELIREL